MVLLTGSCLVGCAGVDLSIVSPGRAIELDPDEGLLIIQITTDVPLKEIALDRGSVATDLPSGNHVWVVRAPAGRYSWSVVDMGEILGGKGRLKLDADDWPNEEEFDFEVHPGAMNYPGDLILKTDQMRRSSGRGISVRNRNHSAMAVRRLRKRYADLLDAYPIRHAGTSGDEFLDFFTRERDETE